MRLEVINSMRNKRLIVILTLVMLLITGCQKENTNDRNNSKENKPSETVDTSKIDTIDEYKYYTTMKCEAFSEEIKYFENGWFVTADNDIYIYNPEGLYSSNDSNCKKLDLMFPDNITFVDRKARWNSKRPTVPNQMAYLNSEKEAVLFIPSEQRLITEPVFGTAHRDAIQWLLKELYRNGYIKIHFGYADGGGGIRYNNLYTALATKGDNHIYLVELNFDYDMENTTEATIEHEDIIFTLPDDEKIVDFYFATTGSVCESHAYDWYEGLICGEERISQYTEESTGKKYGIPEDRPELYILTEKNYYRIMLANEECTKYVDVECRYEWKKDEAISQIRNEIFYRDADTLITKNGRVYSTFIID